MSSENSQSENIEKEVADKKTRTAFILTAAFKENPVLEKIEKERLEKTIGDALDEIEVLEKEACRPLEHLPQTKEEAEKIKTIWDLSGPGTYDQAFKEDRYKDKKWTAWMDRRRLDRSAWLMRKLTEIIIGKEFKVEKGENISHREELKEAIKQKGPYLIYNGTEEENNVLEDVVTRTGVAIPPEKVYVSGKKIIRTTDQVKQFDLPKGMQLKPGDTVVIVSHAPHIARTMRMIEKYRPFPEGVRVKVFPLPTIESGKEEFTNQEIRGILYYTFVTGDAVETPYPYEF